MKLGLFSDLHLHKHNQFAGPDGKQRLRDGLKVLNKIVEIFLREDVDAVMFLGDLFHIRRSIDVEVFNAADDAFIGFSRIPYKIALSGNHDLYGRTGGISALEFLEHHGFTVVTTPMQEVIDRNGFAFIPWMEKKDTEEAIRNFGKVRSPKNRYLFLHCSPKGAVTQTGYTLEDGVDLSSLSKSFTRIFCGDIHRPGEMLENIQILGSPMHLDFGDVGSRRGCYTFETGSDSLEFHPLSPYYPSFHVLRSDINKIDVDELRDSKDYYRIITEEEIPGAEELPNVQVVFKKQTEPGEEEENMDIVSLATSPSKAIEKYTRDKCPKGLDPTRLTDTGKSML